MKFVIDGQEISLGSSQTMTFESTLPTVILQADSWDDNNEQTVTVPGVLADESRQLILPTPAYINQDAFYAAGIRIISQTANAVTFRCNSMPEEDLTVYVAVMQPKVSEDSSNPQSIYSTEEVRIGTWIDGKPLYRIVIEQSGIGSDNTTVNGVAELGVKDFVRIDGLFYDVVSSSQGSLDNVEAVCHYYNSDSYGTFAIRKDGTMYTRNHGRTSCKLRLILEYTKISDE